MLPMATSVDHEMKAALKEADVKSLATQLNAHINVPFIPEAFEQQWIEWILSKAVGVVPAEVVTFLIDASDGLEAEELQHYENVITKLVNDIIDIPVLTENMEEKVIRPVIHQLMQYAVTGAALDI